VKNKEPYLNAEIIAKYLLKSGKVIQIEEIESMLLEIE